MDQDMVSFVLRFVREVSEEQQARWRGVVKHVQSNTEASFSNFAEAMSFIQERVNELLATTYEEADLMTGANRDYNPFLESAKIWSDFMKPYSSMVSETMDEALLRAADSPVSQQMRQAMSSSMAAWGLSAKSDEAQLAQNLQALSEQMAILSAKVDDLSEQLQAAQNAQEVEEE